MLEKIYKQIDIEKISANENQPRTVLMMKRLRN